MNHNTLLLFSKDTDAVNSQRGYNYQNFKTIEAWVNNAVLGVDEDIYCDFKEDIFHRNNELKQLKFRQIKLYSANFSFSSIEIKKCILHFFSLHIQSDDHYSKEYVFETNSGIAAKYKNNDAELLKEWFDHQHNLTEEKIQKYSAKIKSIIFDFVDKIEEDNYAKITVGKSKDSIYNLDEKFWTNFTVSIKWKFLHSNSDIEFDALKSNIDHLINELPFKQDDQKSKLIFPALLQAVILKLNNRAGENRKLTSRELEEIVISLGTLNDQWYIDRMEFYRDFRFVGPFKIGEFYEILDLIKYCRENPHLNCHIDFWVHIAMSYSRNTSVAKQFRKKIIYELIFLKRNLEKKEHLKASNSSLSIGNLNDLTVDIRFYFEDFSDFSSATEIQSARYLLSILFTAIKEGKCMLTTEVVIGWSIALYKTINNRLLTVKNTSEKCRLLEQKGFFLLAANRFRNKRPTEFIIYFEEILTLSEFAPLFKLRRFDNRIREYITLFINHHVFSVDPLILKSLEKFSKQLKPLASKRESRETDAHKSVKLSFDYLHNPSSENLLKALEQFHLAKSDYQTEDSIEKYIVSLLSIADIYNGLRLQFAAKHYALAACRIAIQRDLIQYIEKAIALLYKAHFSAGEWFNAIAFFIKYLGIHSQSNIGSKNTHLDPKHVSTFIFILCFLSRKPNQFSYFVDEIVRKTDIIEGWPLRAIISHLKSEFNSDNVLLEFFKKNFGDTLLIDVGEKRKVSFKALDRTWVVKFPNTYEYLALAEEYISMIQIITSEITSSELDFKFTTANIEVEFQIERHFVLPKFLLSSALITCKVPLYYLNSEKKEDFDRHVTRYVVSFEKILLSISILPPKVFSKMFVDFFKSFNIDSKSQFVDFYQKMHRDVYSKEDFETLQSPYFSKEDIESFIVVKP